MARFERSAWMVIVVALWPFGACGGDKFSKETAGEGSAGTGGGGAGANTAGSGDGAKSGSGIGGGDAGSGAGPGGAGEGNAAGTGGTVGSAGDGNTAGNGNSGGDGAECEPPEEPAARPSCAGETGLECLQESCCTTLPVPCGTFLMGRGEVDECPLTLNCTDVYYNNELPEHTVSVSGFYLDKFEVTVDRMRKFATAYDQWRADGHPLPGEGAHPEIAGTGWDEDWNAFLSADQAALELSLNCDPLATYPPEKNLPHFSVMCATWYQAFAFCVWDGGRLPTEAEWEYAAAGGDENRVFPWGNDAPGADGTLAVWHEYVGFLQGGSAPAGNGRWGHADLAGLLKEWTFDFYDTGWYADPAASGLNPANVTPAGPAHDLWRRTLRNDNWRGTLAEMLRAAFRAEWRPADTEIDIGFRCARSP